MIASFTRCLPFSSPRNLVHLYERQLVCNSSIFQYFKMSSTTSTADAEPDIGSESRQIDNLPSESNSKSLAPGTESVAPDATEGPNRIDARDLDDIDLLPITKKKKRALRKVRKLSALRASSPDSDEIKDLIEARLKRKRFHIIKGYHVPTRDNHLKGCEYVMDQELQLRRVKPYYWHYITHAKGRWDGRTLYDIFSDEYRERSPEYTENLIREGGMSVNGKVAQCETVIHPSDIIEHSSHRHEPPVPDTSVEIVGQSGGLLVVSKPAGIPVHPAGRYRHNSLLNILRKEHGFGNSFLAPCNRLDRLTSGLCFFAATPHASERFRHMLESGVVRKMYIAKVVGDFPEGETECDQPIDVRNPKLGLNRVCASGKASHSRFIKLCSDGRYSIVQCMPLTGRTHQLRVHLQWLGYPIANDPLYANKRVWGPGLGRQGEVVDWETVEKIIDKMGKTETASFEWYTDETPEESQKRHEQRKGELLTGDVCPECQCSLYTDPAPTELSIWLHSWKYWSEYDTAAPGSGWVFQTKLPSWAAEVLRKCGQDDFVDEIRSDFASDSKSKEEKTVDEAS